MQQGYINKRDSKDFTMLKKIYISNKCCSFHIKKNHINIYHGFLKNIKQHSY